MENLLSQGIDGVKSAAKYEFCPQKNNKRKLLLAFFGVFIGIINGLFGAGGGMLVVPVLTGVACMPEKKAHATAIGVILPLCAVSAVVYCMKGSYDFAPFLPSIGGVLIGSIIGAVALKKVNNVALKFIFYGLMLVAGLKMLF